MIFEAAIISLNFICVSVNDDCMYLHPNNTVDHVSYLHISTRKNHKILRDGHAFVEQATSNPIGCLPAHLTSALFYKAASYPVVDITLATLRIPLPHRTCSWSFHLIFLDRLHQLSLRGWVHIRSRSSRPPVIKGNLCSIVCTEFIFSSSVSIAT